MSITKRLETLKKNRGLNWDELADLLGLSRSMIHYVRTGERSMGHKTEFRLRQLEKEDGIRDVEQEELTLIAAAAALAKKRGEPESLGSIIDVLHDAPKAEADLLRWKERAIVAESKLDRMRVGMRELLEMSAELPAHNKPATSSAKLSDAQVLGERAAEKKGHHSKS